MKSSAFIFRFCLCAVMMLSIMAQAAVPAGFMPGERSDGKVGIIICSITGPKEVFVDPANAPMHEQEHPATPDNAHAATCPYSSVLAQSLVPPAPIITAPFSRENQLILSFASVFTPHTPFRPYQAQAPPTFS